MRRVPSPSRLTPAAAIVLGCLLAPVAALATCGDGVVDGGESCDLGALNGDDSSCCTAGCELRAGGAICRPAAGVCDVADTCDGASPECPTVAGRNLALLGTATQSSTLAADTQAANAIDGNTDGGISNGSVTHTNAGSDDWWEVDLGSVQSIEAIRIWNRTDCCTDRLRDFYVLVSDVPFVSGVLADVLVQPGVDAIFHPGAAVVTNDFTVGRTARFVRIQQAYNVIHIAEVEIFAASDGKAAAGTECRASAGVCDVAEQCNGFDNDCPADLRLASGSECRPAAGPCDVTEVCDGTGVACPADVFEAPGTPCRSADGSCDLAESCDGASAACPVDVLRDAGYACRPASGFGDVAETCDGAFDECPADAGICAGQLDTTFAGGFVRRAVSGYGFRLTDMVEQADGAIIALATAESDTGEDIAVFRTLADGTPDPAFDGDGVAVLSFDVYDIATALAVQDDGRIVVVVESYSEMDGPFFRFVRLLPDGSLDPDFGVAGVASHPATPDFWTLNGVVIEADGDILGVGATYDAPLALVRLDAGGQADLALGSGGVASHDPAVFSFQPEDVVLQPDGRLLVLGNGQTDGFIGWDFMVVRLNADGTPDTGFGNAGLVRTHVAWRDFARSVLLQPDGRIVLVGDTGPNSSVRTVTTMRYDSSGQLDPSFGSGGIAFAPHPTISEDINAGTRLANGTIVAAGRFGYRDRPFLVHFRGDGSVATDVGDAGFVIPPPLDGEDTVPRAVLGTRDGKLLVGGDWGNDNDTASLLLARFHGRCESEAWLGYKAKAPKTDALGVALPDDNQLPAPWSVNLEDGLIAGDPDGRENFEVGKAQQILRRAQLHTGPLAGDPGAAYVRYAARPAKEGAGAPTGDAFPKAVKHVPRTWDLDNELGTIRVTSKKARAVLVPAAVDLDTSPAAPAGADTFLCYAVKATQDVTEQTPDDGTGSGKLRRNLQAFVADGADFCALASDGSPAFAGTSAAGTCLVNLGKPVELCNRVSLAPAAPPRETTAGSVDDVAATTGDSLLCYSVKLATKVTGASVAATLGTAIGAKVSPKQTKAPVQSAKAGNPLLTTPGANFPAPLMLDTKGQAVVCLQTQVVDVSELQ